MATPRTETRAFSLLVAAAIVFAPAPTVLNEMGPRPSGPPTGSLVAQILSPTFYEGVVRVEARSSALQQFKRRVSLTIHATFPTLAFAILLLAASVRWSRGAQRLVLTVARPVASRAPPVSP